MARLYDTFRAFELRRVQVDFSSIQPPRVCIAARSAHRAQATNEYPAVKPRNDHSTVLSVGGLSALFLINGMS